MTTGHGLRSEGGGRRGSLVLRFQRSERWLHWALAVPYVVCLLSATVLIVFFNFSPERPHREVVSWVHRAGGLGLIVLPLLALVGTPREIGTHFRNVRQAWGWTLNDLKWLALLGVAAVNRRVRLPEQGKFNAGEKLNFMAVMTSYPLFIMTGILIWLPGVALLSWVVHVLLALAVAPLVVGHVYMAVVNPGTRAGLKGMVTGYVDREWAKEHYRQWYRDSFGDHDLPPAENEGTGETGTPTHSGAAVHQNGARPFLQPGIVGDGTGR